MPRWTACRKKRRASCAARRGTRTRGEIPIRVPARDVPQNRRVVVGERDVGVVRAEARERAEQQRPRREKARRPFREAVEVLGAEARRPRVVEVVAPRELGEQAPEDRRTALSLSTWTWPFQTGSPPRARSCTKRSASGVEPHARVQQQHVFARRRLEPARRASKRPRFGCDTTRAARGRRRARARLRRCRPSSRRPRGRARRRNRSRRAPSASASIVAADAPPRRERE